MPSSLPLGTVRLPGCLLPLTHFCLSSTYAFLSQPHLRISVSAPLMHFCLTPTCAFLSQLHFFISVSAPAAVVAPLGVPVAPFVVLHLHVLLVVVLRGGVRRVSGGVLKTHCRTAEEALMAAQ